MEGMPPPDGSPQDNPQMAKPAGSLLSPKPDNMLFPPLLPLIVGSLVSLLFAALLAHYFSRPIRRLSQAFDAVANGELDIRIAQAMAHRRDELSDLGSDFDRMAERLQKLVEGKQRLLHDVSHELRSPLARLQTVIDLMHQQPERLEEFTARIGLESDRIDKLVEELLTLARLDNRLPGSQAVEVDLNRIIKVIAEDASFEADTKQCKVEIKLPNKICLTGYPDLLHRAIENIVRNAISHTPEGSTITISGKTNSESNLFCLHIMDEGAGVPEKDLKLIFEPFYRSVNADHFQGHGLGMSITQRIVEAHSGKVEIQNRKEGGLMVTLKLPLTTDEIG
jgi:signal transduction histidine kinase